MRLGRETRSKARFSLGLRLGIALGVIGLALACGDLVGNDPDEAPNAAVREGGADGARSGDGGPTPCIDSPGEPEICNGRDDDCDDRTDEGCPTEVVTGPANVRSPTYGLSDGGGVYDDTCPPGEVLIGLSTVTNSWLVQIGGICGKVSVVEATSTTPYAYGVDVIRGTTMPNRGTYSGTSQSLVCPDGGVVIGVGGKAGLYIDQLKLRCGTVAVTGGPGDFGVAVRPAGEIGPIGGDGGGAFAAFACPDGGTFARMVGRSGAYVDRIAFACATPSVKVRP